MLASFMAAEAAGAMGAFEVAGAAMGAAEAASAMEAAGAAEAFGAGEALGAFDASVGLGGGMFGDAGITQAGMASDVVTGGAGAGEAGINAAQVAADQAKATAVHNSGITQAVPQYLDPRQATYLDASTASVSSPVTTDGGRVLAKGIGSAIDANATDMSLGQAGADAAAEAGYGPMGTQSMDMAGATQRAAENITKTPGFGGSSNPFLNGMSSVMDWADKNPFKTAGIAYVGAKKLGLLDDNGATAANRTPDKGMGYSMSPDFQGRFANPEDYQYTPKRYNYADGGIMQAGGTPAYARGGDLSSTLDSYTQMMDQRARPPSGKSSPRGERGDAGIYYDLDPDTRYQDALTAAQIRQAKVNKRANVQMPGVKRPTPMGQIDLTPPGTKREAAGSSLDPENAAQGGIMHSSLGGYAAGGNPRLLKGPGDGMSDNIPATINGRQPARLADGEFVIPADVVSHLGNGSTDAGAKILHKMMTQVRKERTGNPKQGKQINPNKFVPK